MTFFKSTSSTLRDRCAEFDKLCCEEEDTQREYLDLLKDLPPIKERSLEQQAMVDRADDAMRHAAMKRRHWGVI